MKYYPAFLNLHGQPCLVIGGGAVAERKVRGLLQAGAQVRVVSPRLSAGLARLAHEGRITTSLRAYQPGDLDGAFLVIAATDDRQVNESVAAEARQRRVPLNVVDAPDLCSFIAPAVVRRGDITFAVSTGGGSPALARRLREALEKRFPPEYGQVARVVSSVREQLRRRGAKPDAEAWNAALGEEFFTLVLAGRTREARERLLADLGQAVPQKR